MRTTRAVLTQRHMSLLRDFLADSLYNVNYGYFNNQAPVVGYLHPPINFSSIPNRHAYLAEVKRRYTSLQVAWLTPAEIFSPHYGSALARYMSNIIDDNYSNNNEGARDVEIFEIGGGTGTLARDCLSWLKANNRKVYDRCTYTCVEISNRLADLQYQRVVKESGHSSETFQILRGDATNPTTWTVPNHTVHSSPDSACFIVAMEVLDNLFHDKVVYDDQSGSWYETLVMEEEENNFTESATNPFFSRRIDAQRANNPSNFTRKEVLQPVQDALITECLQEWIQLENDRAALHALSDGSKSFFSDLSAYLATTLRQALNTAIDGRQPPSTSLHGHHHTHSSSPVFLPTGALALFKTLHNVRPHHHLIAADFDYLPETVIKGRNAPLVATTKQGITMDHVTYLVEPGTADVFFPSDFELLKRLYCIPRNVDRHDGVRHVKSREFFESIWTAADGEGLPPPTACMNGYDPLLEDYTNTAFLLS